MGSGMPEIGSRISLISKADIRYEGKLFSVDPDECTIALSSVRSYGTEDRETSYPVPAQSQVYDYILFRGTDIKDIRVLTTTIPNDPAIVQLTVPPSLNEAQFQSRTSYPQPPLIPKSIPNATGTSRDQSQTFQNSSAGASSRVSVTDTVLKTKPISHILSENESRSSSPAQHTKNDSRVSAASTKDDESQMQKRNTYNRDKPTTNNRYQQGPRQQYQQRYQQQSQYPHQQQQMYPQQQHQQYRDYRVSQFRNYNDYRDPYGPRQYPQSLRSGQRNENWSNYGQRRNMNRMSQNGAQQNLYQSTGYQNQNRKPKNTLKFEEDYDFEQANTEFEQMKTQLEKIKLDDSVKTNGDVSCKKEESVEVNHEIDLEKDGDEDKPVFYDKVKSFFDGISYEAIERSKGVTTRLDWKTERKINSETFGPLALRRNSNFHGRAGGNQGYYNYQSRNSVMSNHRNNNRYNRQQNNQSRKQYSAVVKNHENGKESRST